MNQDLVIERQRASFPVRKLTHLLYGGQANTERKTKIRQLIQNDPVFRNDDRYFLTRRERYERGLEMTRRLQEINTANNFSEEDKIHLAASLTEFLATSLHDNVFIACLKGQCTPEQLEHWLPLASSKRIIGAYAQTELGHGSNVQGLETTATYVPETDEFDIHSPTLTSTKWWAGCMGKTANHVVAFCRLIVGKTDYGVHPFIVQIRSLENHEPLPGITVGDIGPKFGTEANDNGFLRFNHVRIPRTHLLMRFASLSRDGKYSKPPHAKIAYGTMVYVRSTIVWSTAENLAKGVTIAIRYSAVRRQFSSSKTESEKQILDYTTQQYRLFPLLATAFALRFTGQYMLELYNKLVLALNEGDVSALAETHATSAGLKSFVTEFCASALEECRRCCGGHGYSRLSGLPDLFMNYLPFQTAEGDNYLLSQQTGRYLLKAFQKGLEDPNSLVGNVTYLKNALETLNEPCPISLGFLDPKVQLHAMTHRAIRIISSTANKMQSLVAEGKSFADAWNYLLVDIYNMCRAHCLLTVLVNFHRAVANLQEKDPQLYPVVKRLLDLFALYWIDKEIGDYLYDGYLNGNQAEKIREHIHQLLTSIRPDAIPLVDAWDFSDQELNSVIGRYDGKVYEALYDLVQKEPLNKTQVVQSAWENSLKPLIKGELRPAPRL